MIFDSFHRRTRQFRIDGWQEDAYSTSKGFARLDLCRLDPQRAGRIEEHQERIQEHFRKEKEE